MGGYENFTRQLDLFLKRYYRNKAFKGTLLFLVLLIFLSLLLGGVQLFTFASSAARAFLFYSSLLVLSVAGICLIAYPLLQSRALLPRMSRMQAARYLSSRYPELDDKLYNVLELRAEIPEHSSAAFLLQAAIDQITSGFLSYRFEKAVDFRTTRPFLYLFGFFFSLFLFIAFFEPRVIRSTAQVVRYSEHYEQEFPFVISVANPSLRVPYQEDFRLQVNVEGTRLPQQIYLCQGQRRIPLVSKDPNTFEYLFRQVRRDETFFLKAGKYESPVYVLGVDYKPLLSSMKVVLRYPAYTKKGLQVQTNSLDLEVPYGTRLEWELRVEHARSLTAISFEDISPGIRSFLPVDTQQRPVFRFRKQAFSDFRYQIVPRSYSVTSSDTLAFSVKTVPDAYPRVEVRSFKDSLQPLRTFFQGRIFDDYGFHSLVFAIRCNNLQTGVSWNRYDTLQIDLSRNEQSFTYFLDLSAFPLSPGDEISYGFELSDNDPFFPYKKTYSPLETYRKLSQEEIRRDLERTGAGLDRNLSLSLDQNRLFGENLRKTVEEFLSRKELGWQERQTLQVLIDEQEKLRTTYDRLIGEMDKKRNLENEAGLQDPELMEKQEQLRELLEQLLDDETLEQLKELQQFIDRQEGQDKIMESLEKMKFGQQQSAKDLERNMNLYRQMEFEMRMDRLMRDSRDLLQKGLELKEDLSRQTDRGLENTGDSLVKENRQLSEDLRKLERDMETLGDLDSKLERPNGFSIPDSLLQSLRNSLQETEENLRNRDASRSRESHDQTQDGLQNLFQDLQMQEEQIGRQNAAEDAAFIRTLLKAVLRVSIEQEDLMTRLGKTKVNDPRYADLIRRQSALNLEIRYVSDSVRAISNRQPQVALATRKVLYSLESNSKESLEYLLGMNNVYHRRYSVANSWALTRQQYAMTALNDLALLLSESLEHLKKQMRMKGISSNSKGAKGEPQMSCPNPGEGGKQGEFPSLSVSNEGKKSSPTLSQLQEALNRQIEALKKLLEEQSRQNTGQARQENSSRRSGISGQTDGMQVGNEKVSEAFARAAARQEMIRRKLQEEIGRSKMQDPRSAGKYNSILGQMERTEKDLVNKILSDDLLFRQKQIETRLLEAENAELRREKDDKREAKQGRVFDPAFIDSLPAERKAKKSSEELLRQRVPSLRPFYYDKLQRYLFD